MALGSDAFYFIILLFCVVFGLFYRTLTEKNEKKWIGSVVGLVLVFIISGKDVVHSVITVLVNTIIILHTNKKRCHIKSFTFSFFYLFLLRVAIFFRILNPSQPANLIQMLQTLKMVGLAFEVNSQENLMERHIFDEKNSSVRKKLDVTLADIFHYSTNYIGIIAGPYYSYQTFLDFIELPFARNIEWRKPTIQKIKYSAIFVSLHIIGEYFYPVEKMRQDDFYEASMIYRLWYSTIVNFEIHARFFNAFAVAEAACTVVGMGAYPTFTRPKAGKGPTTNFEQMDELAYDEEELHSETYDFETISSVDMLKIELCPSYKETLRHWNKTIQSWFQEYIFKRTEKRIVRIPLTMLVSAFWHGVHAGYYLAFMTAPLAMLPTENLLHLIDKIQNKNVVTFCRFLMLIVKHMIFQYQMMAFLLLNFKDSMRYYSSVYHWGLIFYFILCLISIISSLIYKLVSRRKTS